MKIEQLVEALSHFPRNSRCVPKEGKDGEVTGLEVRTPEGDATLGYIPTSEQSKTDLDDSDVVY